MKNMEHAVDALDMLMNRTAEYKAFEQALRELNTTLVDLLSQRDSIKPPDNTAEFVSAMTALVAALKAQPAPVVHVAAKASDWDEIVIDAPLDSMGRPSGKMTLRKVRKA